ncbi:DUF4148 domain-containing protein [Comamonas thiooxydans]|uniref:hypothetical protein n=1 Tax=Comamonas thiooxydans TaxID=363952 RepID=UPI000B362A05|nr:hypothetical protein [Comamonas thiooxydans]BDR09405.1 DUF4148 domain-containing protein [Comamonas thiooxydans]
MLRRNLSTTFITSAMITASLLIPGIASASEYWHSANNESGVVTHPEHFKSVKSRKEINAEAAQAVVEGGDSRMRSGKYPGNTPVSSSEKARQQIIDELLKESPEQRESRNRAMAG